MDQTWTRQPQGVSATQTSTPPPVSQVVGGVLGMPLTASGDFVGTPQVRNYTAILLNYYTIILVYYYTIILVYYIRGDFVRTPQVRNCAALYGNIPLYYYTTFAQTLLGRRRYETIRLYY